MSYTCFLPTPLPHSSHYHILQSLSPSYFLWINNSLVLLRRQLYFVVVQLFSYVWHFATPWTAAHQASLSFTISQRLLRLMSIESVMPSNHLILCHPLLLPSIFPSIGAFSSGSALHITWPKDWSFSFNPSSEYSRLISLRIEWFDPLAVQGTLKSLLQHHSLKASILLYGPTLTSIRDYWKNHCSDYMDLCWQNDVSAF